MGFLKNIFDLADDIISIPTDLIGLTNHYEKKEILRKAKESFLNDKITSAEYEKVKKLLE